MENAYFDDHGGAQNWEHYKNLRYQVGDLWVAQTFCSADYSMWKRGKEERREREKKRKIEERL